MSIPVHRLGRSRGAVALIVSLSALQHDRSIFLTDGRLPHHARQTQGLECPDLSQLARDNRPGSGWRDHRFWP